MADDLIIKFFKEDLTEAEENALRALLSSSTEEALRFGQHAEAAYRYYGLPEPQWPGNPPPAGPGLTSSFKIGHWLLLALLGGASAWVGWKYFIHNETQASVSVPVALSPAPKTLEEAQPGHSVLLSKKEIIPDHLTPEWIHPTPKAGQSPVLSIQPAAIEPRLTPVNEAARAHHPHPNLEVLVKRSKPGAATIRVLNPDGSQAVLLFQGMLDPGSWIFDWNGCLADGRAASPGTYQIQVVSGAVIQSKKVVIRK